MSDWYNPFSWGNEDPSDAAQPYMQKSENMLNDIYNPWMEYGQRAMPELEKQMMMLTQNPAAIQSMLGSSFQQSPGYEWQYDQAMNGANQAAAAGGMLGTNAHQQQASSMATGLANQDYWNYYNQNANLYNTGLNGLNNQVNMGYNASNQKAGGLGSLYGNQANLAYSSAMGKNQSASSALGGAMGLAGIAMMPATGGLSGLAALGMF